MAPQKTQSCRILFVSDEFVPFIGGAEKSAVIILSTLAQHGLEISVLTNRSYGTKRRETRNNLKINRENLFLERSLDFFQRCLLYLKAIPIIMKYVVTFKPNIILTQQLISTSVITVAKLFHIPVVVIIHDYWPICYYRSLLKPSGKICSSYDRRLGEVYTCVKNYAQLHRPRTQEPKRLPSPFAAFLSMFILAYTLIVKQLLRRADAIIAVSHFVRKTLISNGFDFRKVQIVYNPVVVKKQRQRESKNLPHILYVGRLDIKKGVEFLLRAMREICMKVTEARLSIVGDGPQKEYLRSLVKRLQIDHCVEFLGKVSDDHLRHLYSSCPVVVVPSIWPEPFGRVVAEAVMYDCPVVASNVGGIPELINHGTGVLVPPGDVTALAEAIASLITNRARSETKPFIRQRFSPDRIARLVLNIVKTTMRTRPN